MKLDLTKRSPEVDSIDYKISKFPDGQQSLQIVNHEMVRYFHNKHKDPIHIISRLNNFSDLELIICGVKSIRGLIGNHPIHLCVPYFMGARSDRKFEIGGINYVKDVIAPIINSLEFERVTVLDPHSDVLEACLNNFQKATNSYWEFIKFALSVLKGDSDEFRPYQYCLVSPDSGAYKKTFDVAKFTGINTIATANKVRDIKTGQIIKTEVFNLPTHRVAKYVIVDDICDGGRTFVELAKAIREVVPTADITLVVTHGIFSAGMDVLAPQFTNIITTNSYKDIDTTTSDIVHQFDVFNQYIIH
jgi:ribose-phosphate pyrophosphokinase